MPTTVPSPGIYFRKGHFNDKLVDDLITVKISVVIITPLGAEEKELVFTGSDLLSVITLIVEAVTNLGVVRGLPVARTLGGSLSGATSPQDRSVSALADGQAPA